jgi:striatin 1/3/4
MHPEDIGQAQPIGNPASQQTLEEMYMPQQKNMRDLSRPSPQPNHQPPAVPLSSNLPSRNSDIQAPPMVRSMAEQPQTRAIGEWPSQFQQPEQSQEEEVTQINHVYDSYGRPVEKDNGEGIKEGLTETEGWDFGETTQFPEPEAKAVPSRPDTDVFPVAQDIPKSPNRHGHNRRKSSMSRRRSADTDLSLGIAAQKVDGSFKVRFGLRGHLDVVRSVIFTGGGSPGEPELCTAGDDGVVKRWIIPARYENHGGMHNSGNDLDIQPYFTHRGHTGSVMCLAAFSPSIASGGRAQGDGWVFSGGQDASVRVWERGRVDPKATLDGHTDAVWTICVLPTTCGNIFGQSSPYGSPDRILLVSGSADGSIKLWSVSSPPSMMSPQGPAPNNTGRRAGGRTRGNSMSSGTAFPTSPQPSIASNTPFNYTLIHTIKRENSDASPTCITPLSTSGANFAVSYSDAAILVYDTKSAEEISSMASLETYNQTPSTGVNAIVATTTGLDGSLTFDSSRGLSEDENVVGGATGSSAIEGTIISGHEDRFIRFFDANSGMHLYPPSLGS